MYDAVHLYAKGLHSLNKAVLVETSGLSCQRERAWEHGTSLINYMKMVSKTLYLSILSCRKQTPLTKCWLNNRANVTNGFPACDQHWKYYCLLRTFRYMICENTTTIIVSVQNVDFFIKLYEPVIIHIL